MPDLSPEAERVLNHLCGVYRGYKANVPTKIARELLLHCDGWGIWNGLRYDVKAKSIGAGVYQVWMEDPHAARERMGDVG